MEKKLTKKQAAENERKACLERIAKWAPKGGTIFAILRKRAPSGMSRVIQFVSFVDGEPYFLGHNIAEALGYRYDSAAEGVRVNGCGMDMAFSVVYELSRALFDGDGYALKSRWL